MYLFIEDGEVTHHDELPGGLDLLDLSELIIIHVKNGIAKRYIDEEWHEVEVV